MYRNRASQEHYAALTRAAVALACALLAHKVQTQTPDNPSPSDLVVSWSQRKLWHLSLSADDSDSSGKYQGSTTLSEDHALTLNGLL